jgi:hypothetical protein
MSFLFPIKIITRSRNIINLSSDGVSSQLGNSPNLQNDVLAFVANCFGKANANINNRLMD